METAINNLDGLLCTSDFFSITNSPKDYIDAQLKCALFLGIEKGRKVAFMYEFEESIEQLVYAIKIKNNILTVYWVKEGIPVQYLNVFQWVWKTMGILPPFNVEHKIIDSQ